MARKKKYKIIIIRLSHPRVVTNLTGSDDILDNQLIRVIANERLFLLLSLIFYVACQRYTLSFSKMGAMGRGTRAEVIFKNVNEGEKMSDMSLSFRYK